MYPPLVHPLTEQVFVIMLEVYNYTSPFTYENVAIHNGWCMWQGKEWTA